MDPKLVEKIVHEVKSQGVFDEFRRDSIADVDTKPAYQNLRQRVEATVKKFLSEQKWSPDLNKIQLRERLRKHITDSGFLDVGVERIVDQVVNPKIGKVFQPKIEDIAYKYLGIPKPAKIETFSLIHQLPTFPVNGNPLKVETSQLLPNDLEQISPDSDRATIKSEDRDDGVGMDVESKTDEEDESPPFEPIENIEAATTKKDELSNTKDLKNAKNEGEREQQQGENESPAAVEGKTDLCFAAHDTSSASQKTDEQESDKDIIHERLKVFQESHSQFSQVSSNSCLSAELHSNHNDCQEFNSKSHENAVNISEEAQMPRFSSENSNEDNTNKNTDKKNELHFDIKQDEIKFEGTKRKSSLQPTEIISQMSDSTNKESHMDDGTDQKHSSNATGLCLFQEKETSSNDHNFKFTKIYVQTEQAEEAAKEASLNEALLEDSATVQLRIVDKSENTQLSVTEPIPAPILKSDIKETESLESRLPPPAAVAFSNSDSNFDERMREVPCETGAVENVSLSTTTATTIAPTTSTRHKKHSNKKSEKDKHREKEREKEKAKARVKEKSRHSSTSKNSSTSRSHHSSSNKRDPSNSGNDKDADLTQATAKLSSSSKAREESRRSGRSGESRHHPTATSSSQQRGEKDKKSVHQSDDHYASKEKVYWRKSTDSNDEDKEADSFGKSRNKCNLPESDKLKSTPVDTKNKSKSENKKPTSSSSTTTNAARSNDECVQKGKYGHEQEKSKIVILNEVLENPSTNFIELSGVASQDSSCIHIERTDDKVRDTDEAEETDQNGDIGSDSDSELHFFEHDENQFQERLQLIDNTINSCRKAVNYFRFGSVSPSRSDLTPTNHTEWEHLNDKPTSSYVASSGGNKRTLNCETKATLHIDCIQYVKTAGEKAAFEGKMDGNKRLKCRQSDAKLVSPTSSEASVNSKENEFISADISGASSQRDLSKNSSSLVEEQTPALNKLNQQRYSNDDLYKPRPFLGQRSRRRGLLDV